MLSGDDHGFVRKLLLLFLLVLSPLVLFSGGALPLPKPSPAPAKKMLVLFKSSEKVTAKENQVRWHLEPVLSKLGWKLDYHDADSSLPGDAQMAAYQGVATWHGTATYKNPAEYVRWMRNQVVSGRKVLIFGNFGAFTADGKTWLTNEVLNEFFLPFGLEYGAAYAGDSAQLQLVSEGNAARAPRPLSYYLLFRSTNPDNQPQVVVRRKDLEKSDSAMVVVTPKGAMVGETYIYKLDGKKIDWLINRDKLLALAMAAPPQDKLSTGGHLLALYKGSEGFDAQTNYISRFLAPTFKELGYTFDTWDINRGLPDPASMNKYSGIVSWYLTASMENAAAYTRWLSDQILAGRKVVVLGNLGAFQELDKTSNPPTERWLLTHEYNTFMYPFGLEFKGAWTKDPKLLKVTTRDPAMIPFLEPQHIGHYYWIQSVHPENKVYLGLNRSDLKEADSAIVVRTPYGGYVLESYLFRDLSGKGDYRWHVDMKKFLADALTYKPAKLPQPWTLSVQPSNPAPVAPAATMPSPPVLPPGTREIKRRVLAFYQRDFKDESDHNKIHGNVETFLNHLGLVVDYRAIEDGLPSSAEMEPYRGIITWFAGATVPNAQGYADWLKAQIQNGKKVVILGDYGAYQDKGLTHQVNPGPTLQALGIDWRAASPITGITLNRTNLVKTQEPSIDYMDPQMCKGEHPINLQDPDLKKGWPVYLSANPANKVYLKVTDKEGQKCDAIIVTPHGGVIAGDFLLYTPPAQPIRAESIDPSRTGPAVADEVELPELRIDAFRFFQEAFATQDLPKCDVTTLNGSRIYFSHIDGDAMQGISFIDRASLNAEMLYREILAPLRLPVTVSFVTNNLEFRATPTYKRELAIARKILELPWIEVASHTTTHPFNWRLGDVKRRPGDDSGRLVRLPPDNRYEILHSIDFTNQLVAPQDKKCKVLLWSGMCNPTEETLALCEAMGVDNMNGGDPVYDSIHPYLIGVSPLYAVVKGRYQFHTCAAGDFYYTGAWTRDYDGMKRLVEYFKYTEEPRRLRAMNLYYHFYLAERDLGIQGLKIAMDYVMRQKPAPMFVSNYIGIVKDMIVSKLGTDEQGNLVIANTGPMRTIRFDDEPRQPDLARSTGVLGFNRAGNRLYVHLDDSKVHRLALAPNPANRLYLERASHYIDRWKATGNEITFVLKGTGPGSFTLAGMEKNGTYKINVAGVGEKSVRTDSDGKLNWEGFLPNYEGTYAVRISR